MKSSDQAKHNTGKLILRLHSYHETHYIKMLALAHAQCLMSPDNFLRLLFLPYNTIASNAKALG